MADQNIELQLDVNTQQAIQNVGQLSTAFDVTSLSLKDAQTQLAGFETLLANPIVAKLNPQLQQSVDDLKAHIDQLNASTKAVSAGSGQAAGQFGNLSNQIKATDADSKNFLDTLTKQRLAFTDIGRIVTGQGFSLRTFASNFALLGPEVVIAAAAIDIFYKKMTELTPAEKAAQAAQEEFNKTLSKTADEVGSSASKITTLVNALQSGTLDTGQRKKALDELKQQNATYFDSLKDEKGVIDGLSSAYDNYLQHLTKIGEAKAVETELTKLFDKKIQLSLSIDPKYITATSEQAQEQLGRLQKELAAKGGAVQLTPQNFQASLADKSLQDRISLEKQINELEAGTNVIRDAGYKKIQDQISATDLQIKGLTDYQKQIGNFDVQGSKTPKPTNELKDELSLLEQLKKSYEDLGKEDNRPLFQKTARANEANSGQGEGAVDVKLLQDKIAKAIQEGAKIGTAQSKAEAQELADNYQKEIDRLRFPNLSSKIKLQPVSDLGSIDKILDIDKINSAIDKSFGDSVKVKIPLDIELAVDEAKQAGKSDSYQKALREVLKDEQDKIKEGHIGEFRIPLKTDLTIDQKAIKKQLSDNDDRISQMVQQDAVDLTVALTEGVASAVSGAKNPFESVFELIGTSLEQLGKQLIIDSEIFKTIKVSLEEAIYDPDLVAVAGVLAVAAGAAIKAEVGKGLKGFATGGLIDGSGTGTSDSILARVSAGEYIVNASAVQKPGVLPLLAAINSGNGLNLASPTFGSPSNTFGAHTRNAFKRNNKEQTFNMNLKNAGQHILISTKRATKLNNLSQ